MNEDNRFFESLSDVDDKYVIEAMPEIKPKKLRFKYIAAGICAASICAAAVGVIVLHNTKKAPDMPYNKNYHYSFEYQDENNHLEKIKPDPGVDGMGFEGFWAHDVSELLENNPWTKECSLTSLPVFAESNNELFSMENYYSAEEMKDRLSGISDELGGEFNVTNEPADGSYIEASVYGARLRMQSSGQISINFNGVLKLPEKYRISDGCGRENAEAAVNYLAERYYDVLKFEYPVPSVYTDYDIYSKPYTRFEVYDKSDDPLTAILNFNFRKASFSGNGDLEYICIYDNLACKTVVGMYPIIDYETAEKMLMDGDYTTTVWEENRLPDGFEADDVTFSGLYYKRTEDYKYNIPYYRFLIELQNSNRPEDMKEYGAFYVPAIAPEYLTDVNTDTAFN